MNSKFLQFLGLTKKAGKLREGYNKCEETIKTWERQTYYIIRGCFK